MKKLFLVISITILSGILSNKTMGQTINPNRPCGIYTKGAAQPGQYLAAIRNYPFVDGHLLLMRWEQIETGKDTFDYSVIDQAVQTLQGYNQKMTLLILCSTVPSYLLKDPNVETYLNVSPLGNDTTETAVPWDTIAISRQINFLNSISSHLVFDTDSQTMLPLRDHPVLKQVAVQVIGVGGLRDPLGSIAKIPGYSRSLIANTFINTTQQYISKFPDQYKYIGVLRINDSITSPDLTTFLLDELNGNFNSGAAPTLGYLNEQLACSTPNTGSAYIYPQKDTTFTMFQMLSSWRNPSPSHAVQTNPCVSNTTGPDVAMQYGLSSFNSTYFEIWVQDLDWAGYNNLFQEWHDTLQILCGQIPLNIDNINANFSNLYPNPTYGKFIIKNIIDLKSVEIHTISGAKMFEYLDLNSTSVNIDLSSFPSGIYISKSIDISGRVSYNKVVIRK